MRKTGRAVGKRAIVIGASSGMGRELARLLSAEGWVLGLAARRMHLLEELQAEIPGLSYAETLDLARPEEIESPLSALVGRLGGVDLFIISAGTGYLNDELDWKKERDTIAVNVTGFARAANFAMTHFLSAGGGHLVGISSIGGLRGNGTAPAYSASKAFVSNYLEGMRCRAVKSAADITVTDIMPGFVDTEMAKGEGIFWMASPATAARRILWAIRHKKQRAYITRRWVLVAWVMRRIPGWVLARL